MGHLAHQVKAFIAARKVSEACLSMWLCLLMRGKSLTCRKRLTQLFKRSKTARSR